MNNTVIIDNPSINQPDDVEKILISKQELQMLYKKIREYEEKIRIFERDQADLLARLNQQCVINE